MNEFNIGDEVVRTGPDCGTIRHGQKCVVSKVVGDFIRLRGHAGNYEPNNFELANSSEVEALQARVAELEKQVSDLQREWKPVGGDAYWFITTTACPCRTSYVEGYFPDQNRLEVGNCFKTEEECQAAAEQVRALLLGIKSGEVVA